MNKIYFIKIKQLKNKDPPMDIEFILALAVLISLIIIFLTLAYLVGSTKKVSKTIGRIVSSKIELVTGKTRSTTIKLISKITLKKKGFTMDQTNLVLGERVRNVIQFSDTNQNARKVENPTLECDPEKTLGEIVEVREWTSQDGSIGTEVEVTAQPLVEGSDIVSLKADPLPGEPEGLVIVQFQINTMSAAVGGSIVSSVIEAVPPPDNNDGAPHSNS